MLSSALPSTALLLGVLAAPCAAQRVRHPQPSAVAAQCGVHLPWHESLEAALAAAKGSGKHVFWYVPTVPRSPMDRKPVIDLFMRSGFFSDPDLCALLGEFELYRGRPARAAAKDYDLVPFRFIEPGFLVLDGKGAVRARAHSITTFSPAWLAGRLARFRKARDELLAVDDPDPKKLEGYLVRQRLTGSPSAARKTLESTEIDVTGSAALTVQKALLTLGEGRAEAALAVLAAGPDAPRVRFLKAACHFRLGRHGAARRAWKALGAAEPESAIGRRAAAEAEGFGPIARGFWVWRDLPEIASDDPGTRMAVTERELPLVRERSVRFLLSMQNEAGGFEDSNYDFGGLDSLPNVYVAVTALCCRALHENRAVDPERCDAAVTRALKYVLDPKNMNPRDNDEWIWARVYVIDLLSHLLAADDVERERKARLRRRLGPLVRDVFTRQRRDGAFRHEYANPFATASVLLALDNARGHGIEPPADKLQRALVSLQRCRNARGAFSYSQGRRGASVAGSAGRMPLCEAALFAWAKSDADRLGRAVEAAFAHHDQLESTRKYDDHANRLAYGGFFFWFDMLGRESAFRRMGEAAKPWRAKQRKLILQIPEIDGCFVDSHELGRCYGTAMALLCLGRD